MSKLNIRSATTAIFAATAGLGAASIPTAADASCWISTYNDAGQQVRATERNSYPFASAAQQCWDRAVRRLQADASKGAVRADAELECRGVTQRRTFWANSRAPAFDGC